MHRRIVSNVRMLGTSLALVMAIGLSAPAGAVVTIDYQDANIIVFKNDDGKWFISKRCIPSNELGGKTIGPGYIYQVNRTSGSTERVITEANWVNGGYHNRSTTLVGLGAFGMHLARTNNPYENLVFTDFNPGTTANRVGTANGNLCWNDPNRPYHAIAAVTGAAVTNGPYVSGGVGYLWIEVTFGNNEVNPLFKVLYKYRIRDSVVNVWTQITTLCSSGDCVAGKRYYVKEPKVVATANGSGADYKRTTCWDQAGTMRQASLHNDPTMGTGQCSWDSRLRIRMDFGTDTTGTDGGCGNNLCLNVVGRAYPHGSGFSPGGTTNTWEGNGAYGLDYWAVLSGTRARMQTIDDGAGEREWCGTPRYDETSGSFDFRRWELVGYNPNDLGHNERSGYFHGWEGGVGPPECESQFAVFGPYGEQWAWFNSYSFGSGWENWTTPN